MRDVLGIQHMLFLSVLGIKTDFVDAHQCSDT